MVKRQKKVFSLIVGIFLIVSQPAGNAIASITLADKVLVIKSERVLRLLKEGTVVKSYEIALGGEPVGPKMRKGDEKTPEGTYILDRRNPYSKFYRSIHVSYPNRSDIENAQKCGVSPGGDIMIHGLPRGMERVGELHTLVNWTKGCIAVTNAQMDEIWRMVPNGTPIEIRP